MRRPAYGNSTPRFGRSSGPNGERPERSAADPVSFGGSYGPWIFPPSHQETHAESAISMRVCLEASVGDTFSLGHRTGRFSKSPITTFSCFREPEEGAAPFWKAEEKAETFIFRTDRQFLEGAEGRWRTPTLRSLSRGKPDEPRAAAELIGFLKNRRRQPGAPAAPPPPGGRIRRRRTGGIPRRFFIRCGEAGQPAAGHVLEAAWQARFGYRIELFVSNDCVVLQLPHEIAAKNCFPRGKRRDRIPFKDTARRLRLLWTRFRSAPDVHCSCRSPSLKNGSLSG